MFKSSCQISGHCLAEKLEWDPCGPFDLYSVLWILYINKYKKENKMVLEICLEVLEIFHCPGTS